MLDNTHMRYQGSAGVAAQSGLILSRVELQAYPFPMTFTREAGEEITLLDVPQGMAVKVSVEQA